MKLVNKLFTRTNKILIVFIMILILLQNIGMSKIIVSFLYFKNGNSFIINDYKIEFPFSHWAYYGENNLTYIVPGRKVDSINLSAEFFKNAEKINISKVISNCDTLKKEKYNTLKFKGNIYICIRRTEETMYFQSDDKKIFIRAIDYNLSNEKVIKEFALLFDSITPRLYDVSTPYHTNQLNI